MAYGTDIKIDGEIDLEMRVGIKNFIVKVGITDLGHLDGILGMNFLKGYGFDLNLSEGTLRKKGWIHYLSEQNVISAQACKAKLLHSFKLPPGHEITLEAFVDSRVSASQTQYILYT